MAIRRSSLVPLATLAALAACDPSDRTAPDAAAPVSEQSITSAACPGCLVGPVVLVRTTGQPVQRQWSFAAAPGAAVLHLDDLGTPGANAEVTLNGARLAWPVGPGGARVHRARLDVTLLAENVLAVRLTGKPGSQLRVALEPVVPTARLTVDIRRLALFPTSGALLGPASGTVTAPGIACTLTDSVPGGDCTESYPVGTAVTLVATPAARSEFREYLWTSGGTASATYTLTVTQDTTIIANFQPAPTYLFVTLQGAGATAWVQGNEILCSLRDGVQQDDCDSRYEGGVLAFSLRVYPMNSTFLGWSGACTGTDIYCPLTSQPGDTVRVTASFAP